MLKDKKIMGIDYGERRIGLSLSDPSKIIASGHSTIDTLKDPTPLDTICKIIEAENVEAVVIGVPERTDGIKGGKSDDVKNWASNLESRINIPIHFQDESYTSVMAKESLKKRKGRKRTRMKKEDIDRVAACFILQEYLNNMDNRYST